MSKMLTISRLTIREVTRRKIALAALIFGLLFLILYNIGLTQIILNNPYFLSQSKLAIHAMDNQLLTAGLYAANFLSIAMAALISADCLAGEISSGTIQCLASKPIPRVTIVLGKWFGLALFLAFYILLLTGGLILSTWYQSGYTPPNILRGFGLIYLGSLTMMSITLAFSSWLSTLATGGIVFGLYGLAFIGSWVEQIGAMVKSQTAIQVGIVASLLLPSEALWRRAAYEISSPFLQMFSGSPFSSYSVPSPAMIIYAMIYLLSALGIAIWVFRKRDL